MARDAKNLAIPTILRTSWRVQVPPCRTTSSRTTYRSRRRFLRHRSFTPSLLLSKSNPLRWASIWFFCFMGIPFIGHPRSAKPPCGNSAAPRFAVVFCRRGLRIVRDGVFGSIPNNNKHWAWTPAGGGLRPMLVLWCYQTMYRSFFASNKSSSRTAGSAMAMRERALSATLRPRKCATPYSVTT